MIKFNKKVWESEFFGKNIWEINDPFEKNVSNEFPSGLITIKLNSQNYIAINDLISLGFSYSEGELTFNKEITKIKKNKTIEFATSRDTKVLQGIVDGLYTSSRFRRPWFSDIDRERFYSEWLKKAIEGTFDDCCILVRNLNMISGFITVKVRDEVAYIGLIGVNRACYKKGIGSTLIEICQQYAFDNGARYLKVATQTSNLAAINLYIKSGFRLEQSTVWMYKDSL
ncbi:GNAT family N-acetyltransferase [Photobacterium halotolerans]|uniref:GNAT family N-acetyltransferase n=1 Tax=Photobacterium halotolerans TaxID=265726 RepID=UPI00068624BB|nr:GNAT family N-acetyltransferase [Photobacterium halotolerans]